MTPDIRDDFEKFISNYKYIGGHKLHLIMSELKSKIDAVEKDKFPRASMAADTLLDNLNKAVYQYEYEDSSIQAFQASYTRAVKDATSILEKDLGWGDYLINLLKSLANAVIWGITLSTSISFFSPTETALGTIVREAKQDLDQGYTNSYD